MSRNTSSCTNMHWNRSCITWCRGMMNSLTMISGRINCRKLITKKSFPVVQTCSWCQKCVNSGASATGKEPSNKPCQLLLQHFKHQNTLTSARPKNKRSTQRNGCWRSAPPLLDEILLFHLQSVRNQRIVFLELI